MSILLADIDATCSGLGNYDGNQYYAAPDALQSLKVITKFTNVHAIYSGIVPFSI